MSIANLEGTVLDGKYRVERQLGAGGMGAVYFATHLGTSRPVALKVIVPKYAGEASFVDRF
jgi:serine/threonine-protein kinase